MHIDTTLAAASPLLTATAENPEALVRDLVGSMEEFLVSILSQTVHFFANITTGFFDQLVVEMDALSILKFLIRYGGAALILFVIAQTLFGKKSILHQPASSTIGILLIYAITVVCYTFREWNLNQFLSPLPFVKFSDTHLLLTPIQGTPMPELYTEILSMLILAFLVNLADALLPDGKTIIGWYVMRLITVIAAIFLHLVVRWGIDKYAVGLFTYAPMILVSFLFLFFFLGLITMVLKLILTIANPFLGGIYTFFFSQQIGKQISNAVYTTFMMLSIIYMFGHFGITTIDISPAALFAYIPIASLLLVLWYMVGRVL